MPKIDSTDRFWYGLGGAFALLLVAGLYITSIGKKSPLAEIEEVVTQSTARTKAAMQEANAAIQEAMDAARKADERIRNRPNDSHDR